MTNFKVRFHNWIGVQQSDNIIKKFERNKKMS